MIKFTNVIPIKNMLDEISLVPRKIRKKTNPKRNITKIFIKNPINRNIFPIIALKFIFVCIDPPCKTFNIH